MQQEDKSSWRCFRGDNGWVYFGEMAWLHTASHEISHDYDSLEEEKKSEYRQVRHGRGVQLYGRTEEGVLVKYEGQWDRDRQAGRGRATLPDASIYEGEWANGLFNGSGNLTWATGDVYRGNWRAGKMEGGGKYVGGEGQTYEGIFRKNYFNHENRAFLDPSLSVADTSLFLEKAAIHSAAQAKRQDAYEKRVRFFRCSSPDELAKALNETMENGRVPFILASSLSKQHCFHILKLASSREELHELDLRELYIEAISDPAKKEAALIAQKKAAKKSRQLAYLAAKGEDLPLIREKAFHRLHETVVNALTHGDVLVLNLDDSSVPYEELFDPDIREFYGVRRFPAQMWSREEMLRRETWDSYMGVLPDISRIEPDEDEPPPVSQVNENFLVRFIEFIILDGGLVTNAHVLRPQRPGLRG